MNTDLETIETPTEHRCHGEDCDKLAMPGRRCRRCDRPVCGLCFPLCACLEEDDDG